MHLVDHDHLEGIEVPRATPKSVFGVQSSRVPCADFAMFFRIKLKYLVITAILCAISYILLAFDGP